LRPFAVSLFRDTPFLSPVDEPPSRFSSGVPMEIEGCLESHIYLSFRVPSKGALHPRSLQTAPIEREREMLHLQSPISTISQSLR